MVKIKKIDRKHIIWELLFSLKKSEIAQIKLGDHKPLSSIL